LGSIAGIGSGRALDAQPGSQRPGPSAAAHVAASIIVDRPVQATPLAGHQCGRPVASLLHVIVFLSTAPP
jgi:hypothetical protein